MLLDRLSVAAKVALAPALALLCLCFVAVIVQLSMARTQNAIVSLEQVRFPAYEAALEIESAIDGVHTLMLQSIAWEGASFNADKVGEVDKRTLAEIERTGKLIAAQVAGGEGESRARLKTIGPTFEKFARGVQNTLDLKSTGLATAGGVMSATEGDYAAAKTELRQVVKAERAATTADFAESQRIAQATQRALLAVLTAAIALSGAAAWLAVRAINGPLRQALGAADALAGGNLTFSVEPRSQDATGQMLTALNRVSGSLSSMVDGIRLSAEHIGQASQEIAQGNGNLSHRTEQQAADLQQTASSVEQLTSTVKATAGNAQQARQLSSEASEAVGSGSQAVTDVVQTMASIDAQAKRIAEIIGTIDGIAFQTNILALNAAVEAARAGEQGRGFAVVASEVRTLAGRSSQAAKEIRVLINTAVEQVEAGSSKVQAAGGAMQRIVHSIGRVEQVVSEISTACNEQAGGIELVNQAVSRMDHVTQQNAALVEEATAASNSLHAEAAQLVRSMASFRTRATV